MLDLLAVLTSDEDVCRKRVSETQNLHVEIALFLKQSNRSVRIAALRFLKSMSKAEKGNR